MRFCFFSWYFGPGLGSRSVEERVPGFRSMGGGRSQAPADWPPRSRMAGFKARPTVVWWTPRWRAMVLRRQPSTSARRRISAARRSEITCRASASPPRAPAAQEIVADDRRARLATAHTGQLPALPRPRGRRSTPHHRLACACGDRRRLPQPAATVMRHFLSLTLPVGLLATRVQVPTAPRLLVPATGRPQAPTPRRLTAPTRAVALTPIAPRADVDRPPTPIAHVTAAIRAGDQETRPPTGLDLDTPMAPYSVPWGHHPRPPGGGRVSFQRSRPRRPFPILPIPHDSRAPPRATMTLNGPGSGSAVRYAAMPRFSTAVDNKSQS